MIVGVGAGLLGEALRQDDVRRSLVLTLTAALITTAIGFIVGVPLAYLLARRDFPGKRAIEGIIDLPIVFPHTAAGSPCSRSTAAQGVVGPARASRHRVHRDGGRHRPRDAVR